MSAQMRKVQDSSAPEVMLVSFTVDPEHDTPEVLAAYAKTFKAATTRWRFLTGPRGTLHMLCKSAFKLGDVDGQLEHSTRFVLVDRKSRIRGYYSTWEADSSKKLLADIRAVSKETD
jgi:protein SCO1/2